MSVASPKIHGKVWLRTFKSKDVCLVELEALRLLTAGQVAKAVASDFNKREGMLIFQSVAETEALIAAKFVEHDPGDHGTDEN